MPVTTERLIMLQKNLKTLRFIFGLNYADLAKYLGLSVKTVRRIETGKSPMTKPYYYAIEKCFNDKRLSIEGNALSGAWYNNMYHLFTETGTDLWEKRRRHIEGVVWIFEMRHNKKARNGGASYDSDRIELYKLLSDIYARPVYFSK